VEARFPIRGKGAELDLDFRRRRREVLHVKFCMTLEQKAEWMRSKIAARKLLENKQ
jgi:hypothetical protein